MNGMVVEWTKHGVVDEQVKGIRVVKGKSVMVVSVYSERKDILHLRVVHIAYLPEAIWGLFTHFVYSFVKRVFLPISVWLWCDMRPKPTERMIFFIFLSSHLS